MLYWVGSSADIFLTSPKKSGIIKSKQSVWDVFAYHFPLFYASISSIRFKPVTSDVKKNRSFAFFFSLLITGFDCA